MTLARKLQLLSLTILLALWLAASPGVWAQAPEGLTVDVRAGYDGYYKPNAWVPVRITAANSGPAIEGELRLTLGSAITNDQVVYNTPISLPTQSNKQVTLYVYLPRFLTNLEVELLDDNGRSLLTATSNRLTQLVPQAILYGVVTPTPGDLDFLQDVTAGRTEAAVAYLSLNELPELSVAWDALDVLILHDVDTGQLSAEQRAALADWVELGGQLVVSGGPGWQKTAVPLADLLPVTATGADSVPDLPALSAQFGEPFRDPGPYLVTLSSLQSGELLAHQDGLPLLARSPLGRGAVYFLALDPSLAPLIDWDGHPALWDQVAQRVPEPSVWRKGFSNVYAAETAVSSLPSLALPSVLQLLLFLLVYVVVVGPVNYAVLKRRNRRELAWLTIPALVILFSLVAYFTGFQIKGNDTILNEMSVAYGAAGSDQMRVHSLLGIYSPRRSSYDVILPNDSVVRPLSDGFSGGGNVGAITRSSDLVLRDVRVDVSGIEAFTVESVRPGPFINGHSTLRVNDGKVELAATLRNDSDITLENAVLLLGSSAYALGDLAPGAEINQVETVGTAGAISAATGSPAFSLTPGIGSPLTANASIILDTIDYYNDRDAYPRWQLLQALEPEFSGLATQTTPGVTLVGWSETAQLTTALAGRENGRSATTLYLIEIPLEQQLVSGSFTVPASLLNWEILADNGVYTQAIHDFYLSPQSSLEIAFRPWPELQTMTVTALAVTLHGDTALNPAVPNVSVWDWNLEEWVELADVVWGETAVSNPQPFIGPNNHVHLRLANTDLNGITISEIYPVLTGDLAP